MKDKFKTIKGELTHYALACGYIQTIENNGLGLTLWHEGDPMFHVRMHNHSEGKRVFWDSFERLTDARKCYNCAVKCYKLKG